MQIIRLPTRTNIGTIHYMSTPTLEVRFFKTDAGAEPVRDWLRELSATDR
jgi:hypothetical protein